MFSLNRLRVHHKKLQSIYFFFMIIILFFMLQITSHGETKPFTARISGYVMNAQTGKPLVNATIIVGANYLKTNENGFFTFNVSSDGWYEIYVFCDYPETEGIDYVPSLWKVYVEKGVNVYKIISLWPGASIEVKGKIRFIEDPSPTSWFKFSIRPSRGVGWGDEYSIDEYGTIDTSKRLGLDPNSIIVPANTPITIEINAFTSKRISKSFIVTPNGAINFILKQGSREVLDIEKFCLEHNLRVVQDSLSQAFNLIYKAKDFGFFVEKERIDIEKASMSLSDFEDLISKGSYERAFALLRNAYILATGIKQEIADLFAKSLHTSLLSIFLISLVSLALSHLFVEKEVKVKFSLCVGRKQNFLLPLRPVATVILYSLFLLLFILRFPGCRLLSFSLLILFILFSPCLALISMKGLPKVLEEKKREGRSISIGSLIITAFSIAAGNLKRRKLRSSLNIVCITMLIFCFIVFTSISPGYGFISRILGPSKLGLNIIMITGMEGIAEYGFFPLWEDLLEDLRENINITLVAPKAESFPSASPVGYLQSSSGKSKALSGFLGILPESETAINRLNESIIEGRCFSDEDENGLLVSKSLAKYLDVKVQDQVSFLGKTFVVTGIFDDEKIERTMEINGRSFLPYRLQPTPGGVYVTQCWSDEIIIMNFKTALKLPNTGISRIYVQLKNSSDLNKEADTIVLTRNCVAWVSFKGELYKKYVGAYFEEKGLGLIPFIAFLTILIIGSIMFRAIEERRLDIFILSSIGLNPTHISFLFLAEASIIGFLAGGLGYLLGTIGYRFIPLISSLEVKEKASIEWGLLSLLFSLVTSILAALLPAIKASTIVTPSHLRKLRFMKEEKPREEGEPWIIELPVRVKLGEIEFFCAYIERKLKELADGLIERVEKIEFLREEKRNNCLRRKVSFEYISGETKRQLRSFNELIIERKMSEDFYRAYLLSFPERNFEESVLKTASLIRRIILEWNVFKPILITSESASIQLYSLIRFFNPKLIYIVTVDNLSDETIKELEELLERDGLGLPQLSVVRIESSASIRNCIEKIGKIVSDVDVVCVSGTSTMLCIALAIAAMKLKKPICYVIPKPNFKGLLEVVFLD